MKLDLSEVRVRLAEERDLAFVLDGYKGILWIEGEQRFWESEKERAGIILEVQEDIEKKNILIAETTDAVGKDEYVGFIGMIVSNKTPFGVNYGDMEEPLCWVTFSWVVSRYRGSGLGRLLYAEVEKYALSLGVKEVWCDVYMCNTNSRAFHEKLGFTPYVLLYRKTLDNSQDSPVENVDSTSSTTNTSATATASATTEGQGVDTV